MKIFEFLRIIMNKNDDIKVGDWVTDVESKYTFVVLDISYDTSPIGDNIEVLYDIHYDDYASFMCAPATRKEIEQACEYMNNLHVEE